MYDVEKRSAALENAAGFARLAACVRPRSKMAALGDVYTLGPPSAFPRTLYKSKCRRRSFLRGSDTSARPRV